MSSIKKEIEAINKHAEQIRQVRRDLEAELKEIDDEKHN